MWDVHSMRNLLFCENNFPSNLIKKHLFCNVVDRDKNELLTFTRSKFGLS